jgi:hypothetical protein
MILTCSFNWSFNVSYLEAPHGSEESFMTEEFVRLFDQLTSEFDTFVHDEGLNATL